MRTPIKLIIAVVVFAIALVGALLVLSAGAGDELTAVPSNLDEGAANDPAVATSKVWKVGDTWTVKVRQDSGAITPDGDRSVAAVPYRFEVVGAATKAGDPWLVHVDQDGAEGPFAKGWNLQYVDQDGVMVLHMVSVGDEPPLEAELASIVLGPQFPYEVRYTAPPKAKTLDAAKLLAQSQLPPSELPSGGSSGAAPPAQAPPTISPDAPAPPVS